MEKLQSLKSETSRGSLPIYLHAQSLLNEQSTAQNPQVLEDLLLSSCDVHDIETAKDCLKQLQDKFGHVKDGSKRVAKLEGRVLELDNKWKDAAKVYEGVAAKDENETVNVQRKVAILRSQGKLDEAIKVLNEYLEVYQSDQDAWHELALLSLKKDDYFSASFCFEELILFNPGNPSFHQACAESLLSIPHSAMPRAVIDARKHLSQSLGVTKKSLRAALGLLYCTSLINESQDKVKSALNIDEDPSLFMKINSGLNKAAIETIESAEMQSGLKEILSKVVKDMKA